MTAFFDYYIPKVEKELGRFLFTSETNKVKQLYIEGWHPTRVSDLLKNKCEFENCWNTRTCFHYCSEHHKEICLSVEIQ